MGRILSIGSMKEMERILTKSLASQKTVTQLLVSASIFSFVFSWSWIGPSMYYEMLYGFSWSSMQLLSIAMNKNCIFLICNGILVFLAKTSAFVRSPSPSDISDMLQKKIDDGLQMQTEAQPVFQKHLMLEECDHVSTEEEKMRSNEEDEDFECWNEREEVSIYIEESDEEGGSSGHEDVENCRPFDDVNDDDDDTDNDGGQIYAEEENDEIEKLSTEELNQKFEDFIRKMKEEFRINEAQQLVMVN